MRPASRLPRDRPTPRADGFVPAILMMGVEADVSPMGGSHPMAIVELPAGMAGLALHVRLGHLFVPAFRANRSVSLSMVLRV